MDCQIRPLGQELFHLPIGQSVFFCHPAHVYLKVRIRRVQAVAHAPGKEQGGIIAEQQEHRARFERHLRRACGLRGQGTHPGRRVLASKRARICICCRLWRRLRHAR